MRVALRLAAVLVAILGVVDPVIQSSTRIPPAIEILLPPPSDPTYEDALELREQAARQLHGVARVSSGDPPRVRVLLGPALPAEGPGPILAVPTRRSPLTIEDVRVPPLTLEGQQTDVVARIRGRGLKGTTLSTRLALQGVSIAEQKHEWSSDEEVAEVRFAVAVPGAGVHRVRLVAKGAGAEALADAVITVRKQAIQVLTYEPRPSWSAAFVRRALEQDPAFAVSSATAVSRGIRTSGAAAPDSLARGDLHRFDVLVVGAPDALGRGDMVALAAYLEARGGRVLLMADRQIPEAVRRTFHLPPLKELLLQQPVAVGAGGLRASEFLVPETPSGGQMVASITDAGKTRPVLLAIPRGAGDLIFVGTLDHWRYRDDKASTAWRSIVADAALASAPPVRVTVSPPIARPGETVTVEAAVRETAFVREGAALVVPPVAASITSADGATEAIRLWPGSRAGMFKALVNAPAVPGTFDVGVETRDEAADAVLTVASDVVHAARSFEPTADAARASGGEVLADITALRGRLLEFSTETTTRAVHPMRSPWWVLPFAGLLAAEWVLRRRAGLR